MCSSRVVNTCSEAADHILHSLFMIDPPIQNLDSVDISGKRRDGGVDLFIVSSSHLDGSLATQQLFKDKLETYVAALGDPEFRQEFGIPHPQRTAIVLACADEPAPEIVDLIARLKPFVERHGASLRYIVRASGDSRR